MAAPELSIQSDRSETSRWLSAHLFLGGSPEQSRADRILADVVAPFVRRCLRDGLVDRCFFIRYGEHGWHLRLRFQGSSDTLAAVVQPSLVAHVAEETAPADLGVPLDTIAAEGTASPLPALWWVPYAPETTRYGGEVGLSFAERLFHDSTQLVFDLLPTIRAGDQDTRFGLALAAMAVVIGLGTADDPSSLDLALVHRERWMRLGAGEGGRVASAREFAAAHERDGAAYADVIRQLILATRDDSSMLPDPFAGYADATSRHLHGALAGIAQGTIAWDADSGRTLGLIGLLSDYMHMTNNRLGISPREEAYLGHLIYETLRTP